MAKDTADTAGNPRFDDVSRYYDLEGNFVTGKVPEGSYVVYDPSIGAMRESTTSPIPDSRYTENAWTLPGAKYNPATGSYEGQGFTWGGVGPAPNDTSGILDLIAGGPLEGSTVINRGGGFYGLDTTGADTTPRQAQPGGELSLGPGSGMPSLPESSFPELPYTGSTGPTFGADPKDAYFGKFLGNTNENLGTGNRGVTGVAPSNPVDTSGNWVEKLGGPLQGFDSSSNKDFYQKQFQEMRAAQSGQKLQDLAAAIRRQEAAKNPQESTVMDDPWSWANLPEVRMGTGGVSGPTSYELNPRFDWGGDTTNQQIIQDLNLSGDELSYLQKNPKKFENAPSFLDQNAFQEFIASNPGDRGYTDTLNKIYQATWTPVPGSTGPAVPVGYASPINVQGAV